MTPEELSETAAADFCEAIDREATDVEGMTGRAHAERGCPCFCHTGSPRGSRAPSDPGASDAGEPLP